MPKFSLDRDLDFFHSIARELVDDVIQTAIVLFKVNLNETKINLYGESTNKTWYPGVQVYALINKDPESVRYEGFGPETDQNITFKLDRWMLEEKGIYPEIGDIINFNDYGVLIDSKDIEKIDEILKNISEEEIYKKKI